MSRRIDCTLTDAQWDELVGAVAHYDCYLESDYQSSEGTAAAARRRGVLDRAWCNILGVSA